MPKIRYIFYAVCAAVLPAVIAYGLPVPENVPFGGRNIYIPESCGVVEDSSLDRYVSGRFVVLIKDAHCNYDAQHNIARILTALVRDYRIDLVAVEGASGYLDFGSFGGMRNKPAREKMADSFLKKGILSGPEYLKAVEDGKLLFNIYGAEDIRLYTENFRALRSTISRMDETQLFIGELKRITGKLKEKIYGKTLLAFDKKAEEYYKNSILLTDWVRELNEAVREAGIELKRYPNVFLTAECIGLEDKIDFEKVEAERASAVNRLGEILPDKDLKQMVRESLRFRMGKISSPSYYGYLQSLLQDAKMDTEDRYSNLMTYIQLVKIRGWINNSALFEETISLEDAVKGRLIKTPLQRRLDDLSKRVRILESMLNLTLRRRELEYYTAHKEKFTPDALLSLIKVQAPLNDIPVSMILNERKFLRKISLVTADGENFYKAAAERDTALVKNTLDMMDKKGKLSAVMVIGGFHAGGIISIFRKRGIGYAVISPNIVKSGEEGLYVSLMMDRKFHIRENAVSSLAFPKIMTNPEIAGAVGAGKWRLELLDAAERIYERYIGKKNRDAFSISVDSEGRVSLKNPGGDIPAVAAEWFRRGIEEVIGQNRDLAEFLGNPENVRKYLTRSALIEYRLRTGGAAAEGILRRATLGFITFYLGLCRAYEEGGILNIPDDMRGEFMPGALKEREKEKAQKWPVLRMELVSTLTQNGMDEETAGAAAEYLFFMPAYLMDEDGNYYKALFFDSYINALRAGGAAQEILNKVQVYRYITAGKDMTEEEIGRKRSPLVWESWQTEALNMPVANEPDVRDSLKRDIYAQAVTRLGLGNELDASDRYSGQRQELDAGLTPYRDALAGYSNRVFVHDISMYLGDVKKTKGGRYEYSGIGDVDLGFLKAVQESGNTQYFLYTKEEEKKAMKAKLREAGVAVSDGQFISPEGYNNINREGKIVVTAAGGRDRVVPQAGDRIIIGRGEGNDVVLVNRLLLIAAGPDTMEPETIKGDVRELLRRYYRGALGEREIDKLLEDGMRTENGIFTILLPPVSPFVREYYDTLLKRREIISSSA